MVHVITHGRYDQFQSEIIASFFNADEAYKELNRLWEERESNMHYYAIDHVPLQ